MDYLIASGDTLSGIARANKVGVQDILRLNPAITDPNRIMAGQKLKLPGATEPITTAQPTTPAIGNVPTFQSATTTVPSNVISAPITRSDIQGRRSELERIALERQRMQEEQAALYSTLAGLQAQTPEEQALARSLALNQAEEQKVLRRAQQEIRQNELNLEGRLASGRDIVSQNIQNEASRRRDDLLFERLVNSASLSALTGLREGQAQALATTIAGKEKAIDRALGIEKDLTGLDEVQRKNTRQTLLDIIDFSQGVSFEELSPEEQSAVINTANMVGVPIASVRQAMQRNKTALVDERRKFETDLTKKTNETLTPYQQFTATQSIAKDTQARTENAREMARQAELIKQSYANIEAGGDRSLNTQAIVTAFNKILDPTSVVRESEYDRTAEGQSLLTRLSAKVQNITAGGAGVSKETLKEATEIAETYLNKAKESILIQNQRARDMAIQFGLNPDFVTAGNIQPATNVQSVAPKVISTGKVGDVTYTVRQK